MSRIVKVAALQPALQWRHTARNLNRIGAISREICSAGCVDLLVFPEHFNATSSRDGAPQEAEEVRQFVCSTARENSVNIVGGSAECFDDDGKLRNICFVSDRQGNVLGQYCKRRLFGGEPARGVQPGDSTGTFQFDFGLVAVLICADLWFSDLVRAAVDGADLLCVPAETCVRNQESTEYARRLWWSLSMTRAHEYALPIAVADVAEVQFPTHWDSGASSINDPSRKPDADAIQQTIPSGVEGYLIVSINLDACAEFREYRRQSGLLA